MRVAYIIALLSCIDFNACAQDTTRTSRTRNIAWVTPVTQNTTINGLCFSPLLAMNWDIKDRGSEYLAINGLNVELSAVGLFAFPVGLFALIGAFVPLEKDAANPYNYAPYESNSNMSLDSKMNGVTIGLGGFLVPNATGLLVNGTVSAPTVMNGVELTGIASAHHKFSGVMVSGILNSAAKGNGLQIGLINKCGDGKVIQIGAFNRIGKRWTPIINFSFKDSNTPKNK